MRLACDHVAYTLCFTLTRMKDDELKLFNKVDLWKVIRENSYDRLTIISQSSYNHLAIIL
jgi:hypothetical protein